MREIAQLLVGREDYSLAEHYAREALARTPGSPYVIDILLQCLIEQRKNNPSALDADQEVADLLGQLEIADRRERSEFINLRQAHFYAALRDFPTAMQWADEAVRKGSSKVSAYATRANIKLRMKNDSAALHSVEADIKQIHKIAADTKGVKAYAGLLAKLRVRFEISKGNLSAAIKQLESVPRENRKLRTMLSLEIANEAVQHAASDADVAAFAHRVLRENSPVQ